MNNKSEVSSREYWIWLVSPRKRKDAIFGLNNLSYRKSWDELTDEERNIVALSFKQFCSESE